MIVQAVLFYIFAAIVVASGVLVVSARNPVHSVLFLILAFFNTAGLFLLIGAEFLAMIVVIVYVGAVAVLFLFVVMMLNIDFQELRSGFVGYLPLGALVGLILLAELILVGGSWFAVPGVPSAAVASATGGIRPDQYPCPRQHPLHALPFCISGSRADFAGCDGRRDRPDLAPSCRCAPPVDLGAARTHPRPVGRNRQGSRGQRQLMAIGLTHYLTVAAILFTLGIFGIFLNRKNVIIMLMSIELMLLAVSINFVAFSVFLDNLVGQAFAMFVLTVAAAEAAIGLAILVVYFRNRGTIRVEDINMMRG